MTTMELNDALGTTNNMSSPSASSDFSMFPPALITISSVLIDASSRSERYNERIWTIVVLWLTASLQQSNINTLVLFWSALHLCFFCSILSCSYQAYVIRYDWAALTRMDFSRSLAPAMIGPLLYSAINSTQPVDQAKVIWNCAILFCVSFVGLCCWRWSSQRTQQLRNECIGMPIVVNNTRSFSPLNENTWYEWSTLQVLQWISALDTSWKHRVCGILAPEFIDGSVLDALSLADLRYMRLPHGDAIRLLDEIDILVKKNPRRTTRGNYGLDEPSSFDIASVTSGWNMGDDARFLMKPPILKEECTVPPSPFSTKPTNGGHTTMDEEMIQKARKLMKEKYGLEIPELNTTMNNSQPIPAAPPSVDTSHLTFLPPEFLESMPPHIYEIASQKPDLVRKIIESRLQNAGPTDTEKTPPENMTASIQHSQLRKSTASVGTYFGAEMDGTYYLPATVEAPTVEGGWDESNLIHDEEMVDTEMTGLLRNRGSKYASTP